MSAQAADRIVMRSAVFVLSVNLPFVVNAKDIRRQFVVSRLPAAA
ncbi:hypothetical protein [Burkholderia sp. TSV86]|nr:hypothetical protein [Burkholderia sp. TSV86]